MKTAVITGTSSGIGHKLALHLIEQGWSVVGCSRRDGRIKNANYRHYKLDLADSRCVAEMFFDMGNYELDHLVLINNAGIANMNHFLLTPSETASEMLKLNVQAAADCMRYYSKLLLKKGIETGRIINFSSVATTRYIAGQLWYAASKSALETATKIASKELADLNVTVNCIRIPYLRTRMSGSIGQSRVADMISNQAIKRPCEYEDIFNLVDFLLLDASKFVTGEAITLGG